MYWSKRHSMNKFAISLQRSLTSSRFHFQHVIFNKRSIGSSHSFLLATSEPPNYSKKQVANFQKSQKELDMEARKLVKELKAEAASIDFATLKSKEREKGMSVVDLAVSGYEHRRAVNCTPFF